MSCKDVSFHQPNVSRRWTAVSGGRRHEKLGSTAGKGGVVDLRWRDSFYDLGKERWTDTILDISGEVVDTVPL